MGRDGRAPVRCVGNCSGPHRATTGPPHPLTHDRRSLKALPDLIVPSNGAGRSSSHIQELLLLLELLRAEISRLICLMRRWCKAASRRRHWNRPFAISRHSYEREWSWHVPRRTPITASLVANQIALERPTNEFFFHYWLFLRVCIWGCGKSYAVLRTPLGEDVSHFAIHLDNRCSSTGGKIPTRSMLRRGIGPGGL